MTFLWGIFDIAGTCRHGQGKKYGLCWTCVTLCVSTSDNTILGDYQMSIIAFQKGDFCCCYLFNTAESIRSPQNIITTIINNKLRKTWFGFLYHFVASENLVWGCICPHPGNALGIVYGMVPDCRHARHTQAPRPYRSGWPSIRMYFTPTSTSWRG